MGLSSDYDSFVYLLTEYLGGPNFARWFQCYHHTQGNTDFFHLQHDFGREWSVFIEKYIISLLQSMVSVEAKTRIYDYAMTLKVSRHRT